MQKILYSVKSIYSNNSSIIFWTSYNYENKYKKYYSKIKQIGGMKCPICLRIRPDDEDHKDSNVKQLFIIPCLHAICTECYETYVKFGKKKCPVCNQNIIGTNTLPKSHSQYSVNEDRLFEGNSLFTPGPELLEARQVQPRVQPRVQPPVQPPVQIQQVVLQIEELRRDKNNEDMYVMNLQQKIDYADL